MCGWIASGQPRAQTGANKLDLEEERECKNKKTSRLSQLFPRQPDGQSHTSGPTQRPPFTHGGSHTPAGRGRENSVTGGGGRVQLVHKKRRREMEEVK